MNRSGVAAIASQAISLILRGTAIVRCGGVRQARASYRLDRSTASVKL
jgi:hypothetical protein